MEKIRITKRELSMLINRLPFNIPINFEIGSEYLLTENGDWPKKELLKIRLDAEAKPKRRRG